MTSSVWAGVAAPATEPWPREAHAACSVVQLGTTTRVDGMPCPSCYAAHFGDPLSERHCYYCSSDAYWHGQWATVGGRLACAECAVELAGAPLPYVRARALYRGRNHGDRRGPEARQLGVYYDVVNVKEAPQRWAHLAAPLGHALAEGVRRLMREEGLPAGSLLVPAPSFQDARPHMRLLAERAAQVLPSVVLAADVLEKVEDFKQSELTRAERRARSLRAYRAGDGARERIAIVVDDFLTTGATLAGCATALLAAGARGVYGAPLVRVIAPPAPALVRDGAIALRLEWLAVAPNGEVANGVPDGTMWAWVLAACPACPESARHGPLRLPAEGQRLAHPVGCACGAERRLHVGREAGHYRVHLEGARGTALWFAPWREA